jgi:hypothetical protein
MVLFFWGALSDEKTGLSFVYTTDPYQSSHSRVRVPWDSRPYFTVSLTGFPQLSSLWLFCTDRVEDTVFKNNCIVACVIVAAETCLPIHFLETAVVSSPVLQWLHSNGCTCYSIVVRFALACPAWGVSGLVSCCWKCCVLDAKWRNFTEIACDRSWSVSTRILYCKTRCQKFSATLL